jgi:hypothetical protein
VQSLLHAAAAAAFGHWLTRWLEVGLAGTGATMVFAGLAAWAGWRWSATSTWLISWSGAQWSASRVGAEARATAPPQVMLDLGHWLLLRIRPADGGRPLWAALSRVDAGAAWHPFRAAVYSFVSDSVPRSPEERPPF